MHRIAQERFEVSEETLTSYNLLKMLQNHSGTSCYLVMRADLLWGRLMLGKIDFYSLESVETIA